MISLKKTKINVRIDCLQSAIQKKSNNKTLSSKSLSKIITIANVQYNFKNDEAKSIFLDRSPVKKINNEGVSKLMEDIESIEKINDNSFISTQIKAWKNNAKILLPKNATPKEKRQQIGKGTRGHVYRDCNFVLKKIKNPTKNEISHEADMCNQYNKKKGELKQLQP